MSRTIRRLPTTGGSIKYYASVNILSVKRHGGTLREYQPGITYMGNFSNGGFGTWTMNESDRSKCVPAEYGGFKVIETFWYQETEADIAKSNAKEILYWCKKNKTCRRQRMNGVRKDKRIAAGKLRAELKRKTYDLCRDQTEYQEYDE